MIIEDKIVDGLIIEDKIVDGLIIEDKIVDDLIIADKIVDGLIMEDKIVDMNLTPIKYKIFHLFYMSLLVLYNLCFSLYFYISYL